MSKMHFTTPAPKSHSSDPVKTRISLNCTATPTQLVPKNVNQLAKVCPKT